MSPLGVFVYLDEGQRQAHGLRIIMFVSLDALWARLAQCLKQPGARLPGNKSGLLFFRAWLSSSPSARFRHLWFIHPQAATATRGTPLIAAATLLLGSSPFPVPGLPKFAAGAPSPHPHRARASPPRAPAVPAPPPLHALLDIRGSRLPLLLNWWKGGPLLLDAASAANVHRRREGPRPRVGQPVVSRGLHRGLPPAIAGGRACSTKSRTGVSSETGAKTSAAADDVDEQVVAMDGGCMTAAMKCLKKLWVTLPHPFPR